MPDVLIFSSMDLSLNEERIVVSNIKEVFWRGFFYLLVEQIIFCH